MSNIILEDDKEVKEFIKIISDINQNMKGVYCNEVNFSPLYILTNKFALYVNKHAVPEILYYRFNESNKLFNYDFKIVIDSVPFFAFLRDFKKDIKKIEINSRNIIFKNSFDKEIHKEELNVEYYNKSIIQMKEFNRIVKEKIYKEELKPVYINDIIKSTENIEFYVDLENHTFSKEIINKQNLGFSLFINKKLINGAYYKIKELKSGTKIDFTPINLEVATTSRQDVYACKLIVNTKNGNIEHMFMVVKY